MLSLFRRHGTPMMAQRQLPEKRLPAEAVWGAACFHRPRELGLSHCIEWVNDSQHRTSCCKCCKDRQARSDWSACSVMWQRRPMLRLVRVRLRAAPMAKGLPGRTIVQRPRKSPWWWVTSPGGHIMLRIALAKARCKARFGTALGVRKLAAFAGTVPFPPDPAPVNACKQHRQPSKPTTEDGI